VPPFVTRVWNALKPPPAVRRWHPTPRQKRLLISTGSGLGAIVLIAGVWSYIASAPQRAQAQVDQGTPLMVPGSYRSAIQHFDRSIQIWPHLAVAYYRRGIAHHLLNETDAAIADLGAAIAENPQFGAAYTERGTILRDRGDRQGALADFDRAVQIEPSPNGFYQRGQTYASLGQPQKAIQDFDRAIAELPDAPFIYSARAAAKRSLGDAAGYKADHDLAVETEYKGRPPAWVDLPLPPDSPQPALAEQQPAPRIAAEHSQKRPAKRKKRKAHAQQ
jgi:tetratricopeptide (TPR) repeat protein